MCWSRLSGSLTATAVEQERCDHKIQQPQQERVQICLPAGRKESFYARSVVFGHGKDHIDTREQQVIGIPEKSRSRRIRQKRQGIHHRRLQRQYTEPRQKKQDSGKQQVRENSTGNAHGNQRAGNHQKTHAEQARRKGQQAVHQQSDVLVCKSTGNNGSQRSQHQQQDYPQQHGSGITQVQGDSFMGQCMVQVRCRPIIQKVEQHQRHQRCRQQHHKQRHIDAPRFIDDFGIMMAAAQADRLGNRLQNGTQHHDHSTEDPDHFALLKTFPQQPQGKVHLLLFHLINPPLA